MNQATIRTEAAKIGHGLEEAMTSTRALVAAMEAAEHPAMGNTCNLARALTQAREQIREIKEKIEEEERRERINASGDPGA